MLCMLQNDLRRLKDELKDKRKTLGDLEQSIQTYKQKLEVEEKKAKEYLVCIYEALLFRSFLFEIQQFCN